MTSSPFNDAEPRIWMIEPSDKAGFAADLGQKIDAGIDSGLLTNLHSVLAARNGKLVLERYYRGVDESWGAPLGTVTFGPETLHDLRSVTKSIIGLLYGIALDHGLVPPPDAPLIGQFPRYGDLASDPLRVQLTVGQALTMTLGQEWDEQRLYTDPANNEIAMETAPDRYRFILERPVIVTPGTKWIYSGGAVALLGALIAMGSGKTLPAFAEEVLFGPLGIDIYEWATGRDGVASAASGLRLRPRDLLKVGQLILEGGRWNGQQVVSQGWLDAPFKQAVPTGDGLGYGRLWYLGEASTPTMPGSQRWVAGFGNGGQRLWLMPDRSLVSVIFSGAYNMPTQWVTPTRVWREIVLANLQRV